MLESCHVTTDEGHYDYLNYDAETEAGVYKSPEGGAILASEGSHLELHRSAIVDSTVDQYDAAYGANRGLGSASGGGISARSATVIMRQSRIAR